MVRRAESDDWLKFDGDRLVLLESEIILLSGIAPAMWHAAAGSIAMQAMVEQIGARHGLPEGYQAAIDAALDELVSRGILERGWHAGSELSSREAAERARSLVPMA